MNHTAGLVLTGGASTRMGLDKATLVVDGDRMVDRVLGVLDEAAVRPVVIAGPHEVSRDDVVTVPDRGETREGPMAGITAGWAELRDRSVASVVVLSCDLRSLDAALVHELIDAAATTESGAVAHDGRHVQPLVAVYHRPALDAIAAAFDAGHRSLRRCFDDWDLAVVHVTADRVADADSPADLDAFDVPDLSRPTRPTDDEPPQASSG